MIYLEDTIDRIITNEGQLLDDLRDLGMDYGLINRTVFRSSIEEYSRVRPIIKRVPVIGPLWRKSMDCLNVVRVMSNFKFAGTDIFIGKEVRQSFEDNGDTIYFPMGYATVHYIVNPKFLWKRKIENSPLFYDEVEADIPYNFELPTSLVRGTLEVNSEFKTVNMALTGRSLVVTFSGDKEVSPANNPTITFSGTSEYDYFDGYSYQEELLQTLMTIRFLRAIANRKSIFTLEDVPFDINRDELLSRAQLLESEYQEKLNSTSRWWEF